MTTIAAGTTQNTGYVATVDSSGNLVFQTNGTTTALTLDTAQNANIAGRVTAVGANIVGNTVITGTLAANATTITGNVSVTGNTFVTGTSRIEGYMHLKGDNNLILFANSSQNSFDTSISSQHWIGRIDTANYHMTTDAGGFAGIANTLGIAGKGGITFGTTNANGTYATGRMILGTDGNLTLGSPTVINRIWGSSGNPLYGVVNKVLTISTPDDTAGNRIGIAFAPAQRVGSGIFVNNVSATSGNEDSNLEFYVSKEGNVNSTLAMTMNANGHIFSSSQVGFLVTDMSPTDFNSGTGTTNVMKGGTANHNVGSGYNSTNGRFTAPVAGYYLITAAILVNGGTGRLEATLYKNDATSINNLNGTGTVYDAPVLSCVVYLAASDWVTIKRVSGTAYPNVHGNHYFSGRLLV